MAQIFRAVKIDSLCLARSYGTQRGQQNYYELLRVSPSSSQREIRQAFIKLSKEMHPDITGKKDHKEFVRMNQAYTVLSKPHTRQQYDMTLKYNSSPGDINGNGAQGKGNDYYNYHYHYYPYSMNMSQKEWEARMRGESTFGREDPTDKSAIAEFPVVLCMTILFVGSLMQMIVLKYTKLHRRNNGQVVINEVYDGDIITDDTEREMQFERLRALLGHDKPTS